MAADPAFADASVIHVVLGLSGNVECLYSLAKIYRVVCLWRKTKRRYFYAYRLMHDDQRQYGWLAPAKGNNNVDA